MSFGHRLRALRQERRLTKKDLAVRSGLNPSSIGYLERRTTLPREQTVRRLAQALAVTEETLARTGREGREGRDNTSLADLNLMTALVRQLPPPDTPWPVERQEAWLATARATLRLLYGDGDECHDETPEPD